MKAFSSLHYLLLRYGLLGGNEEKLCRQCSRVAFVYTRAKPKHLDFRSQYFYRDYDDLASRTDCVFCAFIVQHLGGIVDGAPVETRQWF